MANGTLAWLFWHALDWLDYWVKQARLLQWTQCAAPFPTVVTPTDRRQLRGLRELLGSWSDAAEFHSGTTCRAQNSPLGLIIQLDARGARRPFPRFDDLLNPGTQ